MRRARVHASECPAESQPVQNGGGKRDGERAGIHFQREKRTDDEEAEADHEGVAAGDGVHQPAADEATHDAADGERTHRPGGVGGKNARAARVENPVRDEEEKRVLAHDPRGNDQPVGFGAVGFRRRPQIGGDQFMRAMRLQLVRA